MQTVDDVLNVLRGLASTQTRKTLLRHGAPPDTLGVKIGDLKPLVKQLKGNQELALALYETGQPDAMVLAGMIAGGAQMTKAQLNAWAKGATWRMLAGTTVPAVAVENRAARELALKWIASKKESIAVCGWATYSGIVATRPDEELDLEEIEGLLDRVVAEIDDAPNQARSMMNGFVISVGSYVRPLLAKAKRAAKAIGEVSVDMGDTACQVPIASEYIAKVEGMGRVGKKRKTMKC